MKLDKQPILDNKENDCRNSSSPQTTSESIVRSLKPATSFLKSPSKHVQSKSRQTQPNAFKVCSTPQKNLTKQLPSKIQTKQFHFEHKKLTFSTLTKQKKPETSLCKLPKTTPSKDIQPVSRSRERVTSKPKTPPLKPSVSPNSQPSSSTNLHSPSLLSPHFESIERKFECMQKIFASNDRKLNLGQLSVFLSKLGWIGELDKNLEIQKPEEEFLVSAIFEGLDFDSRKEIQFDFLRNFLAIMSAVFSQGCLPKCFDKSDQSKTVRRTSLSNQKGSFAQQGSQKENKSDGKEFDRLLKIKSCASSPAEADKYCQKFETNIRKYLFPNNDQEMQFSFRKPGESPLKTDFPIKLEYINSLSAQKDMSGYVECRTLESELIQLNEEMFDSKESARKESDRKDSARKKSARKDSARKECVPKDRDINKPEVKESDSTKRTNDEFSIDKLKPKVSRGSFYVDIEIGKKKELIVVHEDDDISALVGIGDIRQQVRRKRGKRQDTSIGAQFRSGT